MPGPKQRRRRYRWPVKWRWSYKHARELHREEERVVLTVLRERGGLGSAASWNDREPTRWDVGYLDKTFKRLSAQGYVHAAGRDMLRPRRHGMRYELTGLGPGRTGERTGMSDEFALIEDAMRGVRVVLCPGCNGLGETLEGICARCGGCGETTSNELEVGRDSQS